MDNYPTLKNAALVVFGMIATVVSTRMVDDNMSSFYLIVFCLLILLIGFLFDYRHIYHNDWRYVNVTKWELPSFGRGVWGGVKIENGMWADLQDCTAEFLGYEDDFSRKHNFSISTILTNDIVPGSLSWQINRVEYEAKQTIRMHNEGYLVLADSVAGEIETYENGEIIKNVYGVPMIGARWVQPTRNGDLYIRLSGYVNSRPLGSRLIAVKILVENDTLFIQDVRDVK